MNFFVKEIKKVDRYGTERIREIRKGRIAAVAILSLFLIITVFSSIRIVPTGFTGIRQTFGQISPVSVEPGFTFVTPYIQKVITIDNRQQDKTFDERIWGETAARTEIYYEGITVSYAIQPEYSVWIYTNLANYKKTLLTSGMVQSAVKARPLIWKIKMQLVVLRLKQQLSLISSRLFLTSMVLTLLL